MAVEIQACKAFANEDSPALKRLLAPDFVLYLINQVIVDRDNLLPAHPGSPQILCLPNDSQVTVHGDVAWVSGIAERNVNDATEQFQIFDLLLRRNDRWTITRRSSARLDPQAYLDAALDLVQRGFYGASSLNWQTLRRQAHDKAAGAQTTIDTYSAIRFVLDQLGSEHSSLSLPDELKKKELNRAFLKSGHADAAETSKRKEDTPRSSFLHRSVPEGKLLRVEGRYFALVVVPFCWYPTRRAGYVDYTKQLLKVMEELIEAHPEGWIIDLRGNQGGNMWPMIAGLAPLLGSPDHLGEFVGPNERSDWFYQNGIGGTRSGAIENDYIRVGSHFADKVEGELEPRVSVQAISPRLIGPVPVAVLVDRGTASSGEATAISFRGRPSTRFFGERTWGLTNSPSEYKLVDNAVIRFPTAIEADRSGKQYGEGLDPDEMVSAGPSPSAATSDPVVAAALKWLSALGKF